MQIEKHISREFKSISSNAQWERIEEALQELSKGIPIQKIKLTLKLFHNYTIVKRKYARSMDFYRSTSLTELFKVYKKQLPAIYSSIARFILQRHDKISIPIFYQNQSKQSNILKTDVLFIICSMATFLVNQQQYHSMPDLEQQFNHLKDFGCIFSAQQFKTRCVIQYIKKQLDAYFEDREKQQKQILTIKRIVLQKDQASVEELIKRKQGLLMRDPQIVGNAVSIESYNGHIKADFANKYIGGGALIGGNVQEQIMFSVHPQLFITPLLCQVMNSKEALFFIGFKKYFKNKGYGYNLAYDGQQTDKYQVQEVQSTINAQIIKQYRVKEYIAGIDATSFQSYSLKKQFSREIIDRQILKAYAGFSGTNGQKNDGSQISIITGNWGCGVFNGTHCLKFIIQWVAASLNQKKMIYCPFGSHKLLNNQKVLALLKGKSITQIYNMLIKAASKVTNRPDSIYEEILKICLH